MEADATTIEQAEPQGSAAPEQDTTTPATGETVEAPSVSFGSLFRQHVERRDAQGNGRAVVSSAARETSATDEQPAPTGATSPRAGGETPDGDDADADAVAQPKLTRAERKAQKLAPVSGEQQAAAGASVPAADPVAPTDDPVLTRLDRIEQRLPPPPTATPADEPAAVAYRERFGDDQEFTRRAEIALHGSQRGQYLDVTEQDELARWSSNRQTRDATAVQYQQQFSGLTVAAAQTFGLDPSVVSAPGSTFRDIFGAFVAHGKAEAAPALAERDKKIADLEAANHQLADENEALLTRLPGAARSVLGGGASATGRAAALADRTNMNGRQLMASGLAQRGQGRRNRPGAR